MKIIELDLTGCNTLYELHERIRVTLDFPEWYGANWDAFWDLLWSDCYANKIVIKGMQSLPAKLQEDRSILCEILERNKQQWAGTGWEFDYEIVS